MLWICTRSNNWLTQFFEKLIKKINDFAPQSYKHGIWPQPVMLMVTKDFTKFDYRIHSGRTYVYVKDNKQIQLNRQQSSSPPHCGVDKLIQWVFILIQNLLSMLEGHLQDTLSKLQGLDSGDIQTNTN